MSPSVRTYLRSPLVILGAVAVATAAQGLIMVHSMSARWAGHWASSSAALGWSTLWGACLACGVTAWVVSAPRRDGFALLLEGSSRSVAVVYGPGLAAVAAGSLVGYAAVAGYIVAVTAPVATFGDPSLMEWAPVAGSVVLFVGVGAAVGRLVTPGIAVIAAAILPYAAYFAATYIDDYFIGRPLFSEFMAMDHTSRDHLRVPLELLACKALTALAVGAALFGWVCRAGRFAYSAVFVAGLTAAGVLLTAGVRYDVPAASSVVCTDGRPRVCVDHAHDHLLGEYRDRVIAGVARLDGMDLGNATFGQDPELRTSSVPNVARETEMDTRRWISVAIVHGNTEPAHKIDARRFAAHFGSGVFLQPCRSEQRVLGPVNAMLYLWWLKVNRLPVDGTNYPGEPPAAVLLTEPGVRDRAQRFAAMSEPDRVRWFTDNREAILSCAVAVP